MHPNGTRLLLATARFGRSHIALASFSSPAPHTTSGRAQDREAAIAEALHLSNVFYADETVEHQILRAEARRTKVSLLLTGDTLHLSTSHADRKRGRAA